MSLSKILEVFCHINQYLLLLIHFAQTAVFQCNTADLYFFLFMFIYIHIYLYILDVVCFVMVVALCVVDPLPLRPGACRVATIQHREPKSMFLFPFYSHAVYSLSLDPFGFWLFTTMHAWKGNTLCSPSRCQSSAQHWNERLGEANTTKHSKIKDADVGKRFASLYAGQWGAKKNTFQVFVDLGMTIFFSFYTDAAEKGNSSIVRQRSCFAPRASHLIAKQTSHQSPTTTTAQHSAWLAGSSRSTTRDTRLRNTHGNVNCLMWFSFSSNLFFFVFLSYFSFSLCVTTAWKDLTLKIWRSCIFMLWVCSHKSVLSSLSKQHFHSRTHIPNSTERGGEKNPKRTNVLTISFN